MPPAGLTTLLRARRLHDLKVGAAHAHTGVLSIADGQEVTAVASTPARTSRPTASSPIGGAGAANDETPADGRGLGRPVITGVTDDATPPSPISQLKPSPTAYGSCPSAQEARSAALKRISASRSAVVGSTIVAADRSAALKRISASRSAVVGSTIVAADRSAALKRISASRSAIRSGVMGAEPGTATAAGPASAAARIGCRPTITPTANVAAAIVASARGRTAQVRPR